MKSLRRTIVLSIILSASVVTFAQTQPAQPVTRAEVRTELAQLRAAGYNPDDWLNYPENIQAAEANVETQRAAYGSSTGSTSASGTAQPGR